VPSLRSKWTANKADRADWQKEGVYLNRYLTDPGAAGPFSTQPSGPLRHPDNADNANHQSLTTDY